MNNTGKTVAITEFIFVVEREGKEGERQIKQVINKTILKRTVININKVI